MIRRHLNGDANELIEHDGREWQYDDPAEHEAAITLLLDGRVSVVEIDDWIEGRHWRDPADQAGVTEARDLVLSRWIAGDRLEAVVLADRIKSLIQLDNLKQVARQKRGARVVRVAVGLRNNNKPPDLDEMIKRAKAAAPEASNRAIAAELKIDEKTVRNHLNVSRK